MSSFLDAVHAILVEAGEPLRAKDIFSKASKAGRPVPKGRTPEQTIGAMLYMDIKKGDRSRFAKDRPGFFKVNSAYPPPLDPDPETKSPKDGESDKKNQHRRIGAAGEFRVMSELLLRGYNADHITIDSGIDIRATRGGNTYEIQVKTATEGRTGKKFIFTIKKEAFKKASGPLTYYIFVLRNHDNGIKHVTVPNKEMMHMIDNGTITENKAGYQVQFAEKDGSLFLRKKDVSHRVNDWKL